MELKPRMSFDEMSQHYCEHNALRPNGTTVGKWAKKLGFIKARQRDNSSAKYCYINSSLIPRSNKKQVEMTLWYAVNESSKEGYFYTEKPERTFERWNDEYTGEERIDNCWDDEFIMFGIEGFEIERFAEFMSMVPDMSWEDEPVEMKVKMTLEIEPISRQIEFKEQQ